MDIAMADPEPQYNMGNVLRAQQVLLSGGTGRGGDHRSGPEDFRAPFFLRCLNALRRWWGWSLVAAVVVAVATAAAVHIKVPVHSAQARVLVAQGVTGQEAGGLSASAIARLIEVPAARDRVAERMGDWARGEVADGEMMPTRDPGCRAEAAELLADKDFSTGILSSVTAEPDGADVSVAVSASVEGRPEMAQALATAAAYSIAEEFMRRKPVDDGGGGGDIERVEEATKKSAEALARLDGDIREIRIRRMTGAAGKLPENVGARLEMLAKVERDLESVEADMLESTEALGNMRGLKGEGDDEKGSAPPHLLKRLVDLEIDLASFAKRYTDEHPRMARLKDEIKTVEEAIARLESSPGSDGAAAGGGLALDIIRTRARLAGLGARADGLRARRGDLIESLKSEDVTGDEATLQAKLRERRAAEQLAAALGGQLMRAKVLGGGGVGGGGSGVIVIPAAAAASEASGLWAILVGAILAAAVAIGAAVVLNHLDVTVRSAADVRGVAGIPTIGVISSFGDDEFVMPDDPMSGPAEAFHVLRNAVRYASRHEPERCLLVTSAGPGEGKSYVAANLAVSFAQEGNLVVVVDADLRAGGEPLLTEAVTPAMGSMDIGLTTYLQGGVAIDDVIVATSSPNLFVVPSGGAAHSPASILRTELMAGLLEDLQQRFNVVIIDAPAVLPVVDAALVSPYVRGVLTVVDSGATRAIDLAEAVGRLKHVHSPLIGAVLNRATAGSIGVGYRDHGASRSDAA